MTSSFQSMVLERGTAAEDPQVGMGATIIMYSDRNPATIVEVGRNADGVATRVVIQQDDWRRTDKLGMTDSGQQYEYTRNVERARQVFTKRKNGRWVHSGEKASNGTGLAIGVREKYHDFSF